MSRLAGILFDKDGTLVDVDRTWGPAAHAVMIRLSGGEGAALDRLVAASHFVVDERRFLPTSPLLTGAAAVFGPLWAAALERPAGADFFAEIERLFREEGLRFLTPIGEPAVIARRLVAAGFGVGIATNDAEASARAQARALGLAPHCAFVAGHDSGYGRKPGPGMVDAFAAHLSVRPGRIAVVGDSADDFLAARAAGAMAVAVLTGPAGDTARGSLASLADHVIGSIADLPDLLAALG
ncbi:HAD-IA family hydrolase [Methylobacterium sp. Leaf466]|uniref:HAD family hydrolase n=1 Tax=Methylobacterium sp. Leaf466 TaxID=1736386 RepID=UPI00070219DA|nr:HAD-IA family hydrolase [Methylobacterium sp. Leaf466]KQT77727.1 hydrolase [Methylobacterium sp. Leaf466]